MPLSAAISLNSRSAIAGQSPSPKATVTVANSGTSAVSVTGLQVTANVVGNSNQVLPMSPSVPAIGPGATTSVPAGGSITFGPFDIAVGSAARVSAFESVGSGGAANPQPSQPAQTNLEVGGTLYGSDGSIHAIRPMSMLLSHSFPPPAGTQGGYLNFAGSANFLGALPGWP